MASNARSSSSGVRNLRAMFETSSSNAEDSTSPPPRGRSPAGESVVSNGSARPLSTVRTSFVAVERSGQLKRINGDGGVEGRVDVKFGIANRDRSKDSSSGALANGKTSSQDNNNMASDTAVDHLEKPTSSGKEQRSALLTADPEGKAAVATNELPPSMVGELKGAAAALSAAEIPLPDTPKPAERSKIKITGSRAPAPLKSSSETDREKSVPAKSTAIVKTEENTSRPLPAPISASRDAAATKSNAKAPASTQATKPPARLPRTPTTPNKPSHSTVVSAKPRTAPATSTEPVKVSAKKLSRTSMGPPATNASSTAHKPRVQGSSSVTASLSKPTLQSSPRSKANQKSPTRPARLPTSIVAPTASSAAKTFNNPPSRPHSRASSNLRRQPSTIQKTEKPSPARPTTTAGVRRQASRPSLPERPHSRNAAVGRKSLSGSTAAPDEGFLARMMRPTASSASKTHEKLPEKVHDKVHERGDAKVVRKAKSVIRRADKSGGSEDAATGDVKRDEHHHETEEVKDNNAGDVEEENIVAAANENEKPAAHQKEEEFPIVEGSSKAEEGEDKPTENAPPPPEVVPELPEVSPAVAAAG
ncbi:MAG: hypothetical protein M1813_004784 [Trichoglossum hirsutum]|nr:MAG: hypothetical protein M1813_004784 [Trichoglossum hirsutum]